VCLLDCLDTSNTACKCNVITMSLLYSRRTANKYTILSF